MDAEHAGPLAHAIASLLANENLTPSQIRRSGGPSVATLWLLRTGKTRAPKAETLQRLATAAARHRGTQALDIAKRDAVYRDLSVAAGYASPAASGARSMLELALFDVIGDMTRVHMWLTVLTEYRALEIGELIDALAAFRRAAEARRSSE